MLQHVPVCFLFLVFFWEEKYLKEFVHYNTLHCTAPHCNTLQHTAIHCNIPWEIPRWLSSICSKYFGTTLAPSCTLQHTATRYKHTAIYRSTPHGTAPHCNKLQHTAPQLWEFCVEKTATGWRRPVGCPKLQVIFRKSATYYRALLQKMTYKDKAFYASTPLCKRPLQKNWRCHCDCLFTATHCNTPQHTATHRSTDRSTPHHAATQFITPWRIPRWWEYSTTAFSVLTLPLWQPLHCNTLQTLQHTATHWNTLQHTATDCNTLQHSATHYNTLQHTTTHYNTLQHTTTHCSTPQHSATHCTTPLRIPWWRDCQTSAQSILALPLQLPLHTFPPPPLPLHGQLRY